MLVAFTDPTAQGSSYDLVELPPWSRQSASPEPVSSSQFLATETNIYEIQQMDSKYRSYLIGSMMVGKISSLFLVTAVDPLFWVLAVQKNNALSTTEKQQQQQQWQPLSQILEPIPSEVRKRLDMAQLDHMFANMSLGGGDEEEDRYYKFSIDKALNWLQNKFRRVQICLQTQKDKAQLLTVNNNFRTDGAFANDFMLAEDLERATESATTFEKSPCTVETHQEQQQVQHQEQIKQQQHEILYESLQVICHYLTPDWQNALRESLKLPEDAITGVPASTNPCATNPSTSKDTDAFPNTIHPSAVVDWNDVNEQESKKMKETKQISIAEKKLQKVDKRGMSKLSAFFAPKKT